MRGLSSAVPHWFLAIVLRKLVRFLKLTYVFFSGKVSFQVEILNMVWTIFFQISGFNKPGISLQKVTCHGLRLLRSVTQRLPDCSHAITRRLGQSSIFTLNNSASRLACL